MKQNYEFSDNYEIIKSIGGGSFADVWLGKHKLTKEKVGIKIINKKKLKHLDGYQAISNDGNPESDEEEQLQINHKFKKEINIMELIKPHPFIIQLFNFIETPNYYHIIMEYCTNGNLAEQLKRYRDRLKQKDIKSNDTKVKKENIIDFSDENEIKKIFTQIIRTVIYFHEKCFIAHRDLKAENIILDTNMNIKIIDFGLGCKIVQKKNDIDINNQDNNSSNASNNNNNDETTRKHEFRWILDDQTICGPPNYVPPEMILKNTIIGEEVDTWMLGVLLYFIVYNCFPYQSNDIKNLISQIAYLDYSLPEKRTVIKEYVKTIRSKSKSSVSQTDSDDDINDEEFNFLKLDMFSSFPRKKKSSQKKSKKKSKNQFQMNEIHFFSSGGDIMSSSSSSDSLPSVLNSSANKEEKILSYQEIEVDVSESCRDLISKMLCKDPLKRITLREVLKHPWILEAKDYVEENENRIQNPENNTNSQQEQELEQKLSQKSLRAAKLTTFFAEKSDEELFEMKNLSIKSVAESFFKNKVIPFDLEKTEKQLKNNIYNKDTEILRILLRREENNHMKTLIDNFLDEK